MTASKLYLPSDIEKLAIKAEKKKKLRKYACTALFLLAVLVILVLKDRLFREENIGFGIFWSAILLLLPFVVTNVPSKLKDTTYCGRIESVNIKTTMGYDTGLKSRKHTGGVSRNYVSINNIYLTVAEPDGKTNTHKAFAVPADSVSFSHITRTYKPGENVFHLCGSSYVIILPEENDESVQCAVCADTNDIKSNVCRSCGHTLIRELPIKPISAYSNINPRF